MNFRSLRADEVECRVAMAKETGVQLLLYKDARCDMNILDETVGSERWQREHYECKGNLFCRVGIKFDEWIWKSDCGKESNTEAEKGEASDSFKRACFNWGIGRELYTAPFIWVSNDKCNIRDKKCYDKFRVGQMTVEDGKITMLEVFNDTKKCTAYSFGKTNISAPVDNIEMRNVNLTEITRLKSLMMVTDTKQETICEYYKVKDIKDLNTVQFAQIEKRLKKKAESNED